MLGHGGLLLGSIVASRAAGRKRAAEAGRVGSTRIRRRAAILVWPYN
jgi:hypothetical protein